MTDYLVERLRERRKLNYGHDLLTRRIFKEAADEIERLRAIAQSSRDSVIEECAKLADGWLARYGETEIKYTTAQEYACDAVEDIADAIRALKASPLPSTNCEAPHGS